MMMKIFGAALIVSGGYFIGWVRVRQWKQRLELLTQIHELINGYSNDLKKYRRSLAESLREGGPIADLILTGEPHKGLIQEDRAMIRELVSQLKSSSYQQSIVTVDDFLGSLEKTIKKVQEETASQGKALPLVTGAIGFLIAVLLY